MTPQRLAVLDYLKDNKKHPSAQKIFQEIKKKFPTVSFATIYNILKAFEEKGLIQGLNIDPERKRFDFNTTLHHHFFCLECGGVKDLDFDLDLSFKGREIGGFKISHFQVSFYGICPRCNTKGREVRNDGNSETSDL